MTLDWTEFFVNFPRQKLPAKISRRELLSAMLSELDGTTSITGGKEAFRLNDLGDLADEHLAPIIPWLVPDIGLEEIDGVLWASPGADQKPLQLFPLQGAIQLAFEQFNGDRSLGEIGALLANAMDWDQSRGFSFVRGMFLSLVFAQVCFPKNPLSL
jgi:hypothetical protein